MFAGIVQFLEPVKKIEKKSGNFIVTVRKPKSLKLKKGDSISVDGVCSTVIKTTDTSFIVEYMPETLKRTTLNNISKNQLVNLEASLKLNDIVSGHLVSGHVDCIGVVNQVQKQKRSKIFIIKYPKKYSKYLIEKGSVSLNGISLTVYNIKANSFWVSLIPHTIKNTNLQYLQKGDKVNLEFDMIAKYVQRICKI